MSDEPWRKEVVDALRRGMKIEAIKLYREGTGVGLAEAKSFVEALEQTLKTGELPESALSISVDLESALVEDLRGGNFIGAIKRYRDATGSDLYDSKQAMEALAQRKGIAIASPAPLAAMAIAFALIIAIAITVFYLAR